MYICIYHYLYTYIFPFVICSCKEEETVSYDAGWQTRGSGRNYASLSGMSK